MIDYLIPQTKHPINSSITASTRVYYLTVYVLLVVSIFYVLCQ
jgi:hypothetical protein